MIQSLAAMVVPGALLMIPDNPSQVRSLDGTTIAIFDHIRIGQHLGAFRNERAAPIADTSNTQQQPGDNFFLTARRLYAN